MYIRILQIFFIFGLSLKSHAFSIKSELGMAQVLSNQFQIPSVTGTRVRAQEGVDSFYGRVEARIQLLPGHFLRALYAPLLVTGVSTPNQNFQFNGVNFNSGVPTHFDYQFNSYRLGYVYEFYNQLKWQFRVGGTAKIRDAMISVDQPSLGRQSYSNVGLVPLLFFESVWNVHEFFTLRGELDGLAAPQGRAIDLAIHGHFNIFPGWQLGLTGRWLEGGADNEKIYNFASIFFSGVNLGGAF